MLLKNKRFQHYDDVSSIFMQIRQALGLTEIQLGIALGEKRANAKQFITDIETGKIDVPIKTLHNLTKIYCELQIHQKSWLNKLKNKLIK